MIRIIFVAAVALLVWMAVQKFKASPPAMRKKMLLQWLLIAFAGLIVLAAATGRIHWIGAVIAALLPLLGRGMQLLVQVAPWLAPWLAKRAKASEDTTKPQHPPAGSMDLAEARKVLGVDENADKDAVIAAHRRLMQKLHPDRGGNDYLAARINEAKRVLLDYLNR
ncbi:DnaJ domain-containing protein [Biformimicrobium ophioploci]|uniref:J domain-containing protein n=1 Tax=Biformimicrobium ophioploci TaxID=3036711 RepID=A0ABQ6M198_9GAMM|nr:DnaJ domain-containing protein [Microbulbifer sp. NKW57]GMG88124.1 hypothetical protein MNKW57_24450 [Microbulbifer sp. NKW57]